MRWTRWLRTRRWLRALAAITARRTEMGSQMIRIASVNSKREKNFKNRLFQSKRR